MELFKYLSFSRELQKRIISAVILAPVVLSIVYVGGMSYQILILVMAIIMSFEWNSIINSDNKNTKKDKKTWVITGVAYIAIFAASLLYLRSIENGFTIVLYLLLVVWATDIGAFFAGRLMGGPKIAPKISPKKTWSGLMGGMIAAFAVGAFVSILLVNVSLLQLAFVSSLLAVVSQAGDFYESWVKRKFGVKDSGNIIPGHGGIMDRMDGFTTVAPILALIYIIRNLGII